MDAHDQLLLAEGVCSQLGIVEYHQNVRPGRKSEADAVKVQSEPQKKNARMLSVKRVSPVETILQELVRSCTFLQVPARVINCQEIFNTFLHIKFISCKIL